MSSTSNFVSRRSGKDFRRFSGNSNGDGDRKSRRPSLASMFSKTSRVNTETRLKTKDFDSWEEGIRDYRSIPWRSFLTQPMLQREEKDAMSIGSLYVHVMEARGLMSSDLNGSSDPYVKLCLTGRYLSHGQEWSERFRLEKQTSVVKRSLDPIWDEEFMLPVRRAGAVLRVDVWDWDRSTADDPLGHFEVIVGEELLSQKPIDMWYVLEPPRGVSISTVAAKARRRGSFTEEEDYHLSQGRQSLEGDTSELESEADREEAPRSSSDLISRGDRGEVQDGGGDTRGHGFSPAYKHEPKGKGATSQNPVLFRRKYSDPVLCEDHSHNSEQGANHCEACIDLRRKALGEVRLKVWFQFDEFAEMCSHVWPEEPLRPESSYFSPNQLYRKGMILYEMARPYLNFAREADLIMSWTQPFRSLFWLVILVIMLLVPQLLIVAVNLAAMRIVFNAYLKHRSGENPHDRDLADDAPSNHPSDASASQSTVNSKLSRSFDAHGGGGERSPTFDGNQVQGLIESPTGSPEHLHSKKQREEVMDGDVSDVGSMHSMHLMHSNPRYHDSLKNGQKHMGVSKFSRTLAAVSRRSSSSEPTKRSSTPSKVAPAELSENSLGQRSTSPDTRINSIAVDPEASMASSGGSGTQTPLSRRVSKDPTSRDASSSWMKIKKMKKMKKLLPTRFTRDPEINELDKRLGSIKKLPLILNEFGKWALGKNGPALQDRVDRFGLTLIKVRERFHPLSAKNLLLMTSALMIHMFLQLWLYHTGRFNLYFVLGCLAQFSNRFYRQWGKAFVLGLKEAFRSRRLRRGFARFPVSSDLDGTANPSLDTLNQEQEHHVFAFAPPGATPASGPIEKSSLSISPRRITGNGRSRSPAGVSPTRGRRVYSPSMHGDNDAEGELEGRLGGARGWSWSHPLRRNRGRTLVMDRYLHSSEPALQGRRGMISPPMRSRGSNDVATPQEGQATEDMHHVGVGDGSVAPSVRPRPPRKSVRGRRRVRWGRVVGALLAVGCIIVGVVQTLRSIPVWFSAAQGGKAWHW